MHLDRTPTDDEINWLWQKVRTCLSTSRTAPNPTTTNPNNPPNLSVANHNNLVNPSTTNNLAHPNISSHCKPPNLNSTNRNNPANSSSTNLDYNKCSIQGSNAKSAVTNGKSKVSQTYIDGTSLIGRPPFNNQRPITNSPYANNYMGSALPARKRLVTMDTLGRLVQRRLPRRPLSGVSQSPLVTVQKTRATSAPATGNRTSGAGEL